MLFKSRSKTFYLPSRTTTIVTGLLMASLLLHTQGYCDASSTSEMDKMAANIIETIFAPWIRRTALAFGGAWGMFQSISGGSYKPLLVWGGLGLIVNFIPKIIAWF